MSKSCFPFRLACPISINYSYPRLWESSIFKRTPRGVTCIDRRGKPCRLLLCCERLRLCSCCPHMGPFFLEVSGGPANLETLSVSARDGCTCSPRGTKGCRVAEWTVGSHLCPHPLKPLCNLDATDRVGWEGEGGVRGVSEQQEDAGMKNVGLP
jgi:hypothetical protein